jgi:hypothetical protein
MSRCIAEMTWDDDDEWDVDAHVTLFGLSGITILLQGSLHHPRTCTHKLSPTFSTMQNYPSTLRCFKDTPRQSLSTNLALKG